MNPRAITYIARINFGEMPLHFTSGDRHLFHMHALG